MVKWIVVGGIWIMAVTGLILFVRGASPARNRAIAMARSREKKRKALAQGETQQDETQQAGTVGDR
jgi:hypothetical protein